MNTNYKKTIAAAVVASTFLLAGASFAGAQSSISDEVKQQIRTAVQAGNFEEVREILQENGISPRGASKRAGHKENRAEVRAAVEANDYNQIPEGENGKKLPEDAFDLLVELKTAKEAGNDDRVEEIKAELKAMKEAKKAEKKEKHEAVKTAIEAGNYTDFRNAVGDDSHFSSIDTTAEFDKLQEAHEARENGDRETAKALMDELGIEKPGGHGKKKGGRGGFRHGQQQ